MQIELFCHRESTNKSTYNSDILSKYTTLSPKVFNYCSDKQLNNQVMSPIFSHITKNKKKNGDDVSKNETTSPFAYENQYYRTLLLAKQAVA